MREPNWYTISGLYPRPRSKRIFIHRPLDRTLVEVRPDMTVLLRDALGRYGPIRRGYGFAVTSSAEEQPRIIDYRGMEQSLLSPEVPAAQLAYRDVGFEYRLTALTTDGSDGNGRLHMYMDVTNLHPTLAKEIFVHVLAIDNYHDAFYRHTNEDYIPFETVDEAWKHGLITGLTASGVDGNHSAAHCDGSNGHWTAMDDSGREVVRFAADAGEWEGCLAGNEEQSPFRNTLRLALTLTPGQSRRISLVAPYPDHSEQSDAASSDRLADNDFPDADTAIEQCRRLWSNALKGGMTVNIPERIVQDVFDTAKMNHFQLMTELSDGSQIIPGQGGFNDYSTVYSWEVSAYLRTLDVMGFGHLTEKTLQYFMSTQQNSKGPDGDIASPEGSFRAHIHWMSETGSVLGIVANHYWMTHDRKWLNSVLEPVLKGCAWIENERAHTKKSALAMGEESRHYGLLPPGRPHDWPNRGYFFFSDTITWHGYYWIARALRDIGHPEAERWMADAEDYRVCILNAVERATYMYPQGEHIRYISNELYTEPGQNVGIYAIDGPINLLETGLISADDKRVAELEHFLRISGKLTDLFACKMEQMEDAELGDLQKEYAGGDIDLYYVNSSERIWHRIWTMQGKREKALRYFYSTMAFSTTLDTLHCHERYCPQLPWMSPWQPNGSGNGRLIDIICDSLYILVEDKLQLLPCVPRDWLDVGKTIQVNGANTRCGTLSFAVTRHSLDRLELSAVIPARVTRCKLTLELGASYRVSQAMQLDPCDAVIESSVNIEENGLSFMLQPGELDQAVRFSVLLSDQSNERKGEFLANKI